MAKKKAKPTRRGTSGAAKKASAPDWGSGFLAAVAETGNIRRACETVGVGRRTIYHRRDSDSAFADALSDALADACDDLEQEARRRARDGLLRVKFHQGNPIMVPIISPDGAPLMNDSGEPVLVPYVEHEYSDTLMIFLLKANGPEKFRERFDHQHTGKGGGPIETKMTLDWDEASRPRPATSDPIEQKIREANGPQ